MKNNNPIHFQFTIDEVNTILTALGKKPYVEVFELIQKIQEQAMPQTSVPQKNNDLTTNEMNTVQ